MHYLAPRLHGVWLGVHAGGVTSEGTEWDWDRFSKIRARQSLRNKQGYNFISGLYRLGDQSCGQQVVRKKVGHMPRRPPLAPRRVQLSPRLHHRPHQRRQLAPAGRAAVGR